MAADNVQTMWEIADADADPVSSVGPTLNALTNIAALLYRWQLAGIRVPEAQWKSISDFTLKSLPNPGVTFADIHAALAQVMTGNRAALEKIIADATGPAADIIRPIAEGIKAIAAQQ